ncbi:unnamed protein product [Protopolystoma xenopodis]|uniref:3'(2'),5'-bisphosphate nucleotidase n=1 Tax=Protopolystoma xenopodis TaxID=117903 RepID=A0A3S5BWF4_9PLAT|nr:unnamed protein product [Protopolystoma xenopodis]
MNYIVADYLVMDLPPALSLLASVVSVASKACEVVRSVLISKDLQIFEKGKSDLQTKADRNSQLCIVHSLKYNFPSLCVIGEEGELQSNDVSLCKDLDKYVLAQDCPKEFSDKKIGDFVVWVDPLDGTNEFVQVSASIVFYYISK